MFCAAGWQWVPLCGDFDEAFGREEAGGGGDWEVGAGLNLDWLVFVLDCLNLFANQV